MGREDRERREGHKDTTALGLDAATFDPSSHFPDYENEFFPVVHFMLDRLQIGLHIHSWSTRILQKFRSFETSICYLV